jgi:hypothetical protein
MGSIGADHANGVQTKKPWIMNAFAMTAPGHLAPGEAKYVKQEC